MNDIGLIIKLGMSAEEVARAVHALSIGEKYKLPTDHFQPSSKFPSLMYLAMTVTGTLAQLA